MTNDAALTVEHLSKFYRLKRGKATAQDVYLRRLAQSAERAKTYGIWALRDVSFALGPGTILGVIGPNGAGKTTLLKVIARITAPTEGRVAGHGRVVPLLEVGSSFHHDLSGRENIYLNAAMYGIPRHEVARKLEDIIAFAGIGEFIDVPLKRYSSGMYLRLAFSVAVNMEPEILLADEVLAVGDLEFQERCLQRVQEVSRTGMTVLFVSHDMAAITRLCDRVLWLNAGQMMKVGDPQEVVNEYQQSVWKIAGSRIRHERKGTHVNQHGEIISTRATSAEGREVGAVRLTDDLGIEITFRILTPDVSVRCAIDVYTRDIHVFRSVQPQEMMVPSPGIYRSIVRIPANFLSESIYTVTVGVAISKGPELFALAEHNALSFQVYDTDASVSARGTYQGRLAGAVSPRLEWDVARL